MRSVTCKVQGSELTTKHCSLVRISIKNQTKSNPSHNKSHNSAYLIPLYCMLSSPSISLRILRTSNLSKISPLRTTAIMATRRSSRITALENKPATPLISSHYKASKAAPVSGKRKFDGITTNVPSSQESQDDTTPKINGTTANASPIAENPPSSKRKTNRRPALVAANTAPRQVKQLAHTEHPLETLAPIPTPLSDRLADPYQTNAPLIPPGTSEVVARTPVPEALPLEDGSIERKEQEGEEVLTTENVLEKALEHLRAVEPKLGPIIDRHHCKVFSAEGLTEVIDPWVSLTSSIIGQQVSYGSVFLVQQHDFPSSFVSLPRYSVCISSNPPSLHDLFSLVSVFFCI